MAASTQRDLDIVDRHIAEAEERIGRQTDLVVELRRDHQGTVAEEAEQLLSTMVDALEEMKERRRIIIEKLTSPKPR